jgi:aminoglycoside 3-N-acetyltransferase I
MTFMVRRLGSGDEAMMRGMNAMFAEAFDDYPSYGRRPPSSAYLSRQLARPEVIALAALQNEEVIGGLVAYILPKLEQERSEIYIYDLAVAETHRRQGIATILIRWLQQHASEVGAWVVYVQADHGDDPAIALYNGLGTREEVLHFDIPAQPTRER